MQRAAATAVSAGAALVAVAGVSGLTSLGGPMPYTPQPPGAADTEAADEVEAAETVEEPEATGGSLATVAKAAAMKAERAAIEQTLRQVHWNRRKAALILGVSYKTLLNKIKECGISRA
jgi:DNA-binding NtrC family response regulator